VQPDSVASSAAFATPIAVFLVDDVGDVRAAVAVRRAHPPP
jgi:hypothetical protein